MFLGMFGVQLVAVRGVSGGFINIHIKCLSFCSFKEGMPWN